MVAEPASAALHIPERDILNALCERERLGTTAVGSGISIPHARMPGAEKTIAWFVRLSEPIHMDAPDDLPVDLFFILLAPESANNEHLRVLSRIARLLRSPEAQERIRSAVSAEGIADIFAHEEA
jgi:PTS system nitrogen regulatory IIA component